MKIDKRVEICIIVSFLLLIALFLSLVGFTVWLFYMVVHYWWRYLGIKTIFFLTTIITVLYLLVRFYKRLVREYRAERLQRFRIWRTFYMELRNEAYLRGATRRRERAERACHIRRENNREFKQRMKRLVEGGKALDDKREQCVQEYKQTLKTREELKKRQGKENGESTSAKNDTPKLLLPLIEERKEKMERIIQRRDEGRKNNSAEKKENNSSINHKVETPNLPSMRATFRSFIEGVKRMDQTCKSYKGPKMYYMLYNIDYSITNVLFAMKELLNTNAGPSEFLSIGLRSNHEILGLCKSATNLGQDMRIEQQDKPSSSTDIQCFEEEIDHLMSDAHSKILLVRDRVLKNIDNLSCDRERTLATRIAQLDVPQIQSYFTQDEIMEAFKDLRDVILPKFRKCITKKMENDKMNTTNMDRWERRFDENMTKVQKRQSLTHLEVGNGYVGKMFIENPLKEKDSLERTQSLWSYVQSDQPEKREKRCRWLERLRRSNKDNSVTYLAVGGAAIVIVTSYMVYRYTR